MSTLFTKIIKREIPAYIVYEDEKVIAFLDISQNTLGHTLVVPKEETESLLTASDDTVAYVNIVAKHLANAIIERMGAQGANILANANPISGQTVMHYHVHVIPRYDVDELKFVVSTHADAIKEVYKKLENITLK